MAVDNLYFNLFACEASDRYSQPLEDRIVGFLEARPGTESLDGPAFSQVNAAQSKADYLLGGRKIVAELKTINAMPHDAIEEKLRERFAQPDSPIVFGQLGVNKVIEGLDDARDINRMMVDIAGRAVRRHLKKANEQIGAIKERLDLADAGGMVILMNNHEPMIDVTMIGYAVQHAFEAVDSSYPHIDYVWASVECHRLPLSHGRLGFPLLHIAKNFENTDHLELIGDMLAAWAECNQSRLEPLPFDGNWAAVKPAYFDGPPVLSPFSPRS